MRKLIYWTWYYATIPVDWLAYQLRADRLWTWLYRFDERLHHWAYVG